MGLPTVAMGILGALISPLAAAGLLLTPSFVPNALAGMALGQALRKRIRPTAFRRGFSICLLLPGGEMPARSIRAGTGQTLNDFARIVRRSSTEARNPGSNSA
ncbi:hypothetical protein LA66_19465 [Aureimonas altamirensis]|uniref:Uncharacterized protein n=1 Tax=Aureimonas altamirensis TaxID=370622 RepID=A0A0B1PYN1_9HYPH|nr:hypothetical protein LA66_19465 [Aureimonas altamirensis]